MQGFSVTTQVEARMQERGSGQNTFIMHTCYEEDQNKNLQQERSGIMMVEVREKLENVRYKCY
ncbi:hypothetical protein KTT_54400 [Tengunoibacter tsumagoiensis]|uniref:Uncharacterized protein n=1 Tax=Tengunoibacter tsumagoiensis TaxID=2014871 RepID=A0A402A9F1_9CHLR|nr:hypothetical protein KTT_54400 [Tengunoibacter tsumagoiensis]